MKYLSTLKFMVSDQSKQANKHTHMRNEVTLVWGSSSSPQLISITVNFSCKLQYTRGKCTQLQYTQLQWVGRSLFLSRVLLEGGMVNQVMGKCTRWSLSGDLGDLLELVHVAPLESVHVAP